MPRIESISLNERENEADKFACMDDEKEYHSLYIVKRVYFDVANKYILIIMAIKESKMNVNPE